MGYRRSHDEATPWLWEAFAVIPATTLLGRFLGWVSRSEIPGALQGFPTRGAALAANPLQPLDFVEPSVNAAVITGTGVLISRAPSSVPGFPRFPEGFVGVMGGAMVILIVSQIAIRAGRDHDRGLLRDWRELFILALQVAPWLIWCVVGQYVRHGWIGGLIGIGPMFVARALRAPGRELIADVRAGKAVPVSNY